MLVIAYWLVLVDVVCWSLVFSLLFGWLWLVVAGWLVVVVVVSWLWLETCQLLLVLGCNCC